MNRITDLLNIQYPIIQGGMVWCSGWKLASAVSNAGGLGLIGSGSMTPELLEQHILKCKEATASPFGVNVPLLYPHADKHIETIIRLQVPVVFTSAGNPQTYTARLKEHGITVVHVIANSKFAQKAEKAGVDALVAEGFEAGGHNGREETTSFILIPLIREITSLPLIAAGGIYNGKSWLAAEVLGADGIQVGTRFAACTESSASEAYKQYVRKAKEGDTLLTLKKLTPVRMLRNPFMESVLRAEEAGYSAEQLKELLGKGRSKQGILEGNLTEGELEAGQVSALFETPETAAEIIADLVAGHEAAKRKVSASTKP